MSPREVFTSTSLKNMIQQNILSANLGVGVRASPDLQPGERRFLQIISVVFSVTLSWIVCRPGF